MVDFTKAAELLGRELEQLPLPILSFAHNISSGEFDKTVKACISELGVKESDVRECGVNFAYGLVRAYERLAFPGFEVPETVISLSPNHMFEGASGKIHFSAADAASSVKAVNSGMVINIPHVSRLNLLQDVGSYIAGFEEMSHAVQHALYPQTKNFGIVYGPNDLHKKADFYYFSAVEIFAGLHIRADMREGNTDSPEIVQILNEADLFVVERLNRGELKHLPDYLKEMITNRETDLAGSGLTFVPPHNLDVAEWERVYKKLPESKVENGHESPVLARLRQACANFKPGV